MKILLTNDDGINADGLNHLWSALKEETELFVVAPEKEHSGMGAAISIQKPLYVKKNPWSYFKEKSWSVSGTPVDCVKVAVNFLNLPIDLIVSGINHGSNSGSNLFYSGTVGAVIDGALKGIPGIAFSYESTEIPEKNDQIELYIRKIIKYIEFNPLPSGTLLNVNFPCPKRTEIKGIRLARQGGGCWTEKFIPGFDEEGVACIRLGGELVRKNKDPNSDISLIEQGYVTVVPVSVEDVTNHHYLSKHNEAFCNYFKLETLSFS
jgi:5'-nucleotidase